MSREIVTGASNQPPTRVHSFRSGLKGKLTVAPIFEFTLSESSCASRALHRRDAKLIAIRIFFARVMSPTHPMSLWRAPQQVLQHECAANRGIKTHRSIDNLCADQLLHHCKIWQVIWWNLCLNVNNT